MKSEFIDRSTIDDSGRAGCRSPGLRLPAELPLSGGDGLPWQAQSDLLEGMARIAANLSHTLNNALSVVCGNLGMIRSQGATDDTEEMLADAAHAMNHVDHLSRNLGALSNLLPFHPVQIDIADLLESRFAQFGSLIEDAHTLTLQVDAPASRAVADPEYLAMALNALVLNASEAMASPGTIRLVCTTASAAAESGKCAADESGAQRNYVVITVSDSGSGMSDKGATRAFDAGYTTKNTAGNAGFGLWFARTFAAASNGALWICDNTPSGVTMALAIPSYKGAAPPPGK